ncbi:Uncharacterised protein [Chlamydia trachomatis]|nr:Uncharacterised protein [Chlamydia trachomatis]
MANSALDSLVYFGPSFLVVGSVLLGVVSFLFDVVALVDFLLSTDFDDEVVVVVVVDFDSGLELFIILGVKNILPTNPIAATAIAMFLFLWLGFFFV